MHCSSKLRVPSRHQVYQNQLLLYSTEVDKKKSVGFYSTVHIYIFMLCTARWQLKILIFSHLPGAHGLRDNVDDDLLVSWE